MPDGSTEETGLPEQLEDRVYEIFSDLPVVDRDAAVVGLLSANEAHAEELRSLIARLQSGDQVLTSVAKDGPVLAAPERVGAYRVLRKLGEGGFGVVYLAEQEEPVRREVALKLILPGMDSRRVLARFEAERQALARMDHPCIAKVFDAGIAADQRPFFAMEYVPGNSITQYSDTRDLTIVERIRLLIRVGEGVQHAHQKGIVHRDLKPSNVLVFEQDDRAQPKIIDFGIAKAMEEPLTGSSLATLEGHLVGTPEYMSPEQADPTDLDIDTRTDIYSLGVILYELVVGELPIPRQLFRGKSLPQIQRLVCETEPVRPSRGVLGLKGLDELAGHRRTSRTGLVRTLTGDIDWILLKALAKDREERYASASEFMDDLGRFLNHEPVSAGPPSVTYRMRKFVRRYRTQVGAASAVLLALVTGLIVSTSLYGALQKTHIDLQESHKTLAASKADVATHLGNFRRLKDVVLYEQLRKVADGEDLRPSVPSKIPAFKAWQRRARSLVGRLDQHNATLSSLRKTAKVIPASSTDAQPHYELLLPSDQFLHHELTTLVANVKRMQEPWGILWSVERRLAWAETVEQKTIGDHTADWARAIREIENNPKYGSLQLRPQLGLIPLGADPRSTLYEFFLPRSGDAPKRGTDGFFDTKDETGMVLVLIPGGALKLSEECEPGNE